MSRWRRRIGEKGAGVLLRETSDNALKIKLVKPEQLTRINVDTTVSQNNTAFPTDARLYKRAIDLLVKEAKLDHIVLRRTTVM